MTKRNSESNQNRTWIYPYPILNFYLGFYLELLCKITVPDRKIAHFQ